MEYLETTLINNIILKHHSLKIYRQYINPIPKDKCNYRFNEFNRYHSKLNATIETKTESKIKFLHLIVAKWNHQKFVIYKPTWTGKYLSLISKHLVSQKHQLL